MATAPGTGGGVKSSEGFCQGADALSTCNRAESCREVSLPRGRARRSLRSESRLPLRKHMHIPHCAKTAGIGTLGSSEFA